MCFVIFKYTGEQWRVSAILVFYPIIYTTSQFFQQINVTANKHSLHIMHAHIITGTCIILYNIEKYFKTIKDAISQNLDYSSRIIFFASWVM